MEPGSAYGFFDCDAPYERLNNLPALHAIANSPSELELRLHTSTDTIQGDDILRELADIAMNGNGVRYMLQATYEGNDNAAAAEEIVPLLNQLQLINAEVTGENIFHACIVYKQADTYQMQGNTTFFD